MRGRHREEGRQHVKQQRREEGRVGEASEQRWYRHDTSLFSRLVLGCIETKFSNKYAFFQVFRDLQNYLADFLKKLQII